MTHTVCAWCGAVKQEGAGPISHGICEVCAVKFKLNQYPALMKPHADRYADCPHCYYRDLDGDGITDGCMAPRGICIAPGKRSPWKY